MRAELTDWLLLLLSGLIFLSLLYGGTSSTVKLLSSYRRIFPLLSFFLASSLPSLKFPLLFPFTPSHFLFRFLSINIYIYIYIFLVLILVDFVSSSSFIAFSLFF